VHIYTAQYAKHKPSQRQKNGTKPSKQVREHEDIKILWSQEVHTYRDVPETMPDIIIKNKEVH